MTLTPRWRNTAALGAVDSARTVRRNPLAPIDTPRRLAFTAAIVCFLVLALTAPAIPIVWDEGEYLWRGDEVLSWFRLIGDIGNPEGGVHAFSQEVIRSHWRFVILEEGHPAGGIIPMIAARALIGGVLHPLTAYRLGTIAVFSVACGVVAFRMRKVYGMVAAVSTVAALLTFPRLFSEAHFATLDGQVTAWWLMLWAADVSLRSDVRSTLGVGVLAGLTSAAKFSGWLAWLPLVASRAFSRDRSGRFALLLIVPAALLVFYVVNPPIWRHPIDGLSTHVQLNLHRTLNVPIAFLGRIYDLHTSLPWYNTIAWLVFVTPVPVLVLGLAGLVYCVRKRDPVAVAVLLHWATLMVVRAIPGAPPHDGVRLILPAFAFWCVLAGIGAQRTWELSRRHEQTTRGMLLRAAVVIGLAGGAVNLARYYPQTLSHYSLLVGGVRGAASMGMEPTYWWDALDNDVLTWINLHTEPDSKVAFSSIANVSMIRGWNRLTPAQADRRGVFKWYVLQNRTGFLGPSDRLLMRTQTPAYTKFAGHRPDGSRVPADLNVPLILIYTYDQFKAAVASTYGTP